MNKHKFFLDLAVSIGLLLGLMVSLGGISQAATDRRAAKTVTDFNILKVTPGGLDRTAIDLEPIEGLEPRTPVVIPPQTPLLQGSSVLTLSKKVTPTDVAPNETITYTLTFTNQGPFMATGVVITDELPIYVTNPAATGSGVTITQTNIGVLTYTWDLQDLPPDQGGSIVITAVLATGLNGGFNFTNTATISATTAEAEKTAQVGVNVLNVAPTAVDDSESTDEDNGLTIQVLDNDNDLNGDSLDIDTAGSPPNGSAAINGSTIIYTPTLNFNGTDSFTYTVSDGDLTDTGTVTVTVNPVNDPPVLDPVGDRTVGEGNLLLFTPTASDPDAGDTLSFSYSNIPSGASIIGGKTFSWLPSETQGPGTYNLTIEVFDDGSPVLTDSETITITVEEVNQAPVLDPVGNQTVDEENLLSFTVTASDADIPANNLSFSLGPGGPGGANVTVDGQFTWTPSEAEGPGDYPVTIIVADDGSPVLTDSETITITVEEVNQAPVLDPVGNQTVDEENLLSFTVTASDADIPANNLSFSLGPGGPGGANVTVDGQFTWTPSEAEGPGDYPVTIIVADDGSPVLTDSETITVTVIEVAELSISKAAVPDSVVAGSGNFLTYILSVTNDGPSEATDVEVTDQLPEGVTFVTASETSCNEDDGTVTCSLSSLARDEMVMITIIVTVDSATTGTIVNTATVTSPLVDRHLIDNTATTSTIIDTRADLSLSKTDSPDPVLLASPLSYTLEVTNGGPSDATGVVVTDTLPNNVTFSSASAGCSHAGGAVTCTLGSLVKGGMSSATLVVIPTATGSITNSAEVGSNVTDTYTTNNRAEATTQVNPKADLSLKMVDSPDPVVAGNIMTYTVTITNNGPSTATGVELTDSLPTEVNLISATPSSGSCPGTNPVTCNLNNIPDDNVATVTIVVTVSSSFTGSLSNMASVTANEADPSSDNNSATESTSVSAEGPKPSLVYLPFIIKSPPTLLSVHNDNTGGMVTFSVLGTGVSCEVDNGQIEFCGSFPPGTYNIRVVSVCGPPTTFNKSYDSGPVTTRVFCK